MDGHLPPKKDGASSMWGKAVEIPRLIALRRAALRAAGSNGSLKNKIHLSLEIYMPSHELGPAGDLDNFVTGVCDGLMAASSQSKLPERWNDPALTDIHPERVVAIVDDSAVVSIMATKNHDRQGRRWYKICLEGTP